MHITDGLSELEARQAEVRRQFEEQMKVNERIAIRAILAGVRTKLFAQKAILQFTLSQQAQVMKNYASMTYVNNIDKGFQSETANEAKEILQGLTKPSFEAPIK